MSLKVWLPLINNFNNQGTYINNPTNTGATVSTAGPLGGSYSFDGTDDQIKATYPSAENTMTVCMWVTFTKLNVHLLDMRNSSGVGYQPAYVGDSGVQVGGTSNGNYPYINFVPTLNTWYHLAIVYSASKTDLYVNGALYGSASNSVGYNYNMDMEVHLGSRYNGQNWFGGNISDFRIYNEALSAYEVKVIARGLLLHYTTPNTNATFTNGAIVKDSSGYNRDLTVYTSGSNYISNFSSKDFRYYFGWYTNTGGNYLSCTSPSTNTKTISFWLRTPKTNSTVFFADYKSKLAFGFNSSGYIIPTCDSLTVNMYAGTNIIANELYYITLRKNVAGTDVDLFINGEQQTSRSSGNYWTHSTDTLMIGQRSSGSPMTDTAFSDFRMYGTRLSDEDIVNLYNTGLKQLNNGKSNPFELYEDTVGKVQVKKSGLLVNNSFVESTTGNKFKATQAISNEFIER